MTTTRPLQIAPNVSDNTTSSAASSEQLDDLLGLPNRKTRRWVRPLVILLLALGALAVLSRGRDARIAATALQWETRAASMGDLTVTVSATGNLRPINQVDVGTEISGLVEVVLVDDNDLVKKGQLLARLDESRLRDQIARSEATLATAKARVLQAKASVLEATSRLERLREVEKLSGGKVPSPLELDSAEATRERALADQASAEAAVAEAEAQLSSNRVDLARASIRSPIDGVVLARHIEPGQTVAATFQAPILFTLAEDLADMELHVDVDEADIGSMAVDHPATFQVDAYPARTYEAEVQRVGYGSRLQEGVVSYLTILSADNQDLSLRPGMTATAEIQIASLNDVLLVPNAALRFRPPAASEDGRGFMARLTPRPPTNDRRDGDGSSVWILEEDQSLRELPLEIGASDGRLTHVVGGDLSADAQVVVAERLGGS